MADLTLSEALSRLETLGDRIAKQCEDTMKSVTPVGRTGNMKKSIHYTKESDERYFIGTDMYYAEWVENGRGEVRPRHSGKRASLMWVDYNGDINSVHHGTPGKVYYRRHAGPSKPNPFVGRAKRIIDQMTFTL